MLTRTHQSGIIACMNSRISILSFIAILVIVLGSMSTADARSSLGTKADYRAGQSRSAAQSLKNVDSICAITVDYLWDGADDYFHLGDYPRSVAESRVITAADPHFEEAYADGGWLLESMHQYDAAEAYYMQGVQNNPNDSFVYYSLGFFYYNTLHNYAMAQKVFDRDVLTHDAYVNDWKMLAHSQEKQGNWAGALATWKQTKSRFPNGPAVEVGLLRAQTHVSAGAVAPAPAK